MALQAECGGICCILCSIRKPLKRSTWRCSHGMLGGRSPPPSFPHAVSFWVYLWKVVRQSAPEGRTSTWKAKRCDSCVKVDLKTGQSNLKRTLCRSISNINWSVYVTWKCLLARWYFLLSSSCTYYECNSPLFFWHFCFVGVLFLYCWVICSWLKL